MPSISDKLKSMGVQSGARHLEPPRPRGVSSLEAILGGQPLQTRQGETFVVEARYPVGERRGQLEMQIDAPLHALAEWAGEERLRRLPPQAFAFLDTETTGLSTGAGTYAFMIGVGRFETGQNSAPEFHLAQFFLRDPSQEAAQLYALEEFLAPCQAIVTFNGKAFDAPLLQTRYTLHGWQAPFTCMAHLDLLHLARKLWRERLPSRTLANLEVHILGATRSEEDVPGWMIPQIYMDYLYSGDVQLLKRVFYHNAMDVLSLAALMNYMALLLEDPLVLGSKHSVDLLSLAKLFEDLGRLETATRLYIHGLEHEDVRRERLPRPLLLKALQRLALIYKRRGDWQEAVVLWEQAARHGHLDAHLELAKCYEHRLQDYPQAMRWTQAAIDLVENSPGTPGEPPPNALESYDVRGQWLAELAHRMGRLQRKASSRI
ncbi:MAG: ribonuclease H-like domain-containing protein [Anaerolineales bacterium]|nr:ribonuclease H-like domain-containing protein [Anaerolineales bacterium]